MNFFYLVEKKTRPERDFCFEDLEDEAQKLAERRISPEVQLDRTHDNRPLEIVGEREREKSYEEIKKRIKQAGPQLDRQETGRNTDMTHKERILSLTESEVNVK